MQVGIGEGGRGSKRRQWRVCGRLGSGSAGRGRVAVEGVLLYYSWSAGGPTHMLIHIGAGNSADCSVTSFRCHDV